MGPPPPPQQGPGSMPQGAPSQNGSMQGGDMPGGDMPGGDMQGGDMPGGNMQGGDMQGPNMQCFLQCVKDFTQNLTAVFGQSDLMQGEDGMMNRNANQIFNSTMLVEICA
jgi:hypothetical protein